MYSSKKSGQLLIVPMLVLEMWRDETGNDAKRLHNFEMFWKQVRAFFITMILIYNDQALKHVKKTWFLQHHSTTSLELPTFLLPCHLTVRQPYHHHLINYVNIPKWHVRHHFNICQCFYWLIWINQSTSTWIWKMHRASNVSPWQESIPGSTWALPKRN